MTKDDAFKAILKEVIKDRYIIPTPPSSVPTIPKCTGGIPAEIRTQRCITQPLLP